MVERFRPMPKAGDPFRMLLRAEGEFVRYTDYAELEAENERLTKERDDLQNRHDSLEHALDGIKARAEALSRTGAVKVDTQALNLAISKWLTDSDLHVTISDAEALHDAILSALEPAAPEGRQDDEPRAYIVHAPEDDYHGTGPDRLQFHPLAQHDMNNGYRQTPLYGRPTHELSGNTGELIDKMAEAIRGDTTSDDAPWATLSEDRKIGWRGDAERALAVVKECLTALRPTERAVTEAHKLLLWAADSFEAHAKTADAPDEIDGYLGSAEMYREAASALKAAMEAGR